MDCEYCGLGGGEHKPGCPNEKPKILMCDLCGHEIHTEYEEYYTTSDGTIMCSECGHKDEEEDEEEE